MRLGRPTRRRPRAPACAGNLTYVGEEGAAIAAAAAAEAAEAAAAAAVPNASVAALPECPTRFNPKRSTILPARRRVFDRLCGRGGLGERDRRVLGTVLRKTVLESLFSEPFLFLVVLLLLVALASRARRAVGEARARAHDEAARGGAYRQGAVAPNGGVSLD